MNNKIIYLQLKKIYPDLKLVFFKYDESENYKNSVRNELPVLDFIKYFNAEIINIGLHITATFKIFTPWDLNSKDGEDEKIITDEDIMLLETVYSSLGKVMNNGNFDFYYNFTDLDNKKVSAIIAQMKLISIKRLKRKLYDLPDNLLKEIKNKLKSFL